MNLNCGFFGDGDMREYIENLAIKDKKSKNILASNQGPKFFEYEKKELLY